MTTFAQRAKGDLLAIYEAALAAADPQAAVERALCKEGGVLRVGGRSFDLARFSGVQVLAVGKAAAAMARGAGRVLGASIAGGLAVTSRGNATDDAPVPVLVAGHPIPDC